MRAYDPAAGEAAAELMPGLDVRPDPYEASAGADVVALLTEWDELRWLDFERVRCRDAAARRSSTPGTCSIRPRCAGAASSTAASVPARYEREPGDRRDVVHEPDRGDRRRGIRRLAPVRGAARARRRGRRGRQPLHEPASRTSTICSTDAGFELIVADVVEEHPGRRPGRRRAAPREPGQPARVPRDAARDARRRARSGRGGRSTSRARTTRAFLLASTSEVYGDPLVHPQPENYNGNVDPVGPRAVYDEAKRFAETLTMTYHRLYDVPTRIVRIFNTYGPRPAPGRRPRRVELPGAGDRRRAAHGLRDGERRRVRSATSTTRCAASSRCSTPTSSSRSTSATRSSSRCCELAALVCEVAGVAARARRSSRCPIGDPTRRQPDITRARQLLGWEPTIELREGLERTHAWYLEERARGRA